LSGGDFYEPSLTADVRAGKDRVIWSRIGLEQSGTAWTVLPVIVPAP